MYIWDNVLHILCLFVSGLLMCWVGWGRLLPIVSRWLGPPIEASVLSLRLSLWPQHIPQVCSVCEEFVNDLYIANSDVLTSTCVILVCVDFTVSSPSVSSLSSGEHPLCHPWVPLLSEGGVGGTSPQTFSRYTRGGQFCCEVLEEWWARDHGECNSEYNNDGE